MKNLFGWMLAALLALTVGVSCSDDDDLNEGAGIASPAWKAENQAVIEGETLDFEFTAEGRWTAVSSADWCEVKTPSGVAGESLHEQTPTQKLRIPPCNLRYFVIYC